MVSQIFDFLYFGVNFIFVFWVNYINSFSIFSFFIFWCHCLNFLIFSVLMSQTLFLFDKYLNF